MRIYSKKIYYSVGKDVLRDNNVVTSLGSEAEAKSHADELNRMFRSGSTELNGFVNLLRDEIGLYEDKELTAEVIVESLKDMIDSRTINITPKKK